MRYPFVRDYTAHASDNTRVQWTHPIQEMSDEKLFKLLLKNMLSKNESIGKTAYLGAMDIILHGKLEFIISSMKSGGTQAFRRLFDEADPLNKGWNGLGAGLKLLEAMLKCGLTLRKYLLQNWCYMLRPLKKQFDIIGKIMSFDEFCPALSEKSHRKRDWSKCNQSNNSNDKIRDYCYQIRATIKNDPRRLLDGEEGIKFTDYLRRFESILLTASDSTRDSVDELFRANKLLDPTHLTMAETDVQLPQCMADYIPGPRLNYYNLIDRDDLKKSSNVENYFEDNIAILAERNLNYVLFNGLEDLNVMKASKKEDMQKDLIKQKIVEAPIKQKEQEFKEETDSEIDRSKLPIKFGFSEENPRAQKNLKLAITNTTAKHKQSTKLALSDRQNAKIAVEEVMTKIAEDHPSLLSEDAADDLIEVIYREEFKGSVISHDSTQHSSSDSDDSTSQGNASNILTNDISKNENFKGSPMKMSNITPNSSKMQIRTTPVSMTEKLTCSVLSRNLKNIIPKDVKTNIKVSTTPNQFESSVYIKQEVREVEIHKITPSGKGTSAELSHRKLRKKIRRRGCRPKIKMKDNNNDIADRETIISNRSRCSNRDNKRPDVQILFGKRYSSCSRQTGQIPYESSSSTVDCF